MRFYFDVGTYDGNSTEKNIHLGNTMLYVFEPNPEMISILKRRFGHHKNYKITEKAVSDIEYEEKNFYLSPNGCSSLNTFQPKEILDKSWPGRWDFRVTNEIKVPVIRLDNFIESIKEKDNIVIDRIEYFHCSTQGNDLEVLMGMGKYLKIIDRGCIKMPSSHTQKIYSNQKYITEDAIKFLKDNKFYISKIRSHDNKNNEVFIDFENNEEMVLTKGIEYKINIGIVISGRINTNRIQYENFFKMFLENYDPDIFVSHPKRYPNKILKEFVEIYKPKKIIENDEIHDKIQYSGKRIITNLHHTLCMFKNRMNCIKLIKDYQYETGKNYDIIISTRCDLRFEDKIHFHQFSKDGIHIPSNNDWGGINDQFAFGNYEDMMLYLDLYNNLNNLLDRGITLHPETLLKFHLIDKNMKISRFPSDYGIYR